MAIEMLSPEEFATLAPKVDANQAFMRANNGNGKGPKDRPFPDIGNDETGKVEQYRLRTEQPDSFGAYLSGDGQSVTTWTGDKLGSVYNLTETRHNAYFRFIMAGKPYQGRGGGRGMHCGCKATKSA